MDHQDRLLERVEALERQTEMLTQYTRTVERLLRWWRGTACGLVMLNLLSLALSSGKAADAPAGGMAGCVATLEDTLTARAFDAAANEVVITGANLRIVNGLGSTRTTNGLGNLIVGYNEPRPSELSPENRTGSHHVVVGQGHNFSSFGGLVVGRNNEISGEFASVSGGLNNRASGDLSSVRGGADNRANGDGSSIGGGRSNSTLVAAGAVFEVSSISGGSENGAGGNSSSVSGGNGLLQNADFGWAAGSFGGELSGSFRSP